MIILAEFLSIKSLASIINIRVFQSCHLYGYLFPTYPYFNAKLL